MIKNAEQRWWIMQSFRLISILIYCKANATILKITFLKTLFAIKNSYLIWKSLKFAVSSHAFIVAILQLQKKLFPVLNSCEMQFAVFIYLLSSLRDYWRGCTKLLKRSIEISMIEKHWMELSTWPKLANIELWKVHISCTLIGNIKNVTATCTFYESW